MPELSADWVQAGELGFAFVICILCAALVLYVIRTGQKREELLLQALMQSNSKLAEIAGVIQSLKDDLAQRLDTIEDTLKIKARKKEATK